VEEARWPLTYLRLTRLKLRVHHGRIRRNFTTAKEEK